MKIVLLSGPYAAPTDYERLHNIRVAEAWAQRVWSLGGACICPHRNSAHFGGLVGEEVFLRGYLEILKRCDGLALIPGWDSSTGATSEFDLAEELSIPSFFLGRPDGVEAFTEWLREVVTP
jgi:hypothetical protein